MVKNNTVTSSKKATRAKARHSPYSFKAPRNEVSDAILRQGQKEMERNQQQHLELQQLLQSRPPRPMTDDEKRQAEDDETVYQALKDEFEEQLEGRIPTASELEDSVWDHLLSTVKTFADWRQYFKCAEPKDFGLALDIRSTSHMISGEKFFHCVR
jgi:hypothetical protein